MNEVLRQEKKYLIDTCKMYELSNYFEQVMTADKHNGLKGYQIRSLYFDSIDDRDFQEKEEGLEVRRKIRLRCYGPTSKVAKLEIKQKQGDLQMKRSLSISREDAIELTKRNYGVLLKYSENFAKEIYVIMNEHCYLPKSVVEYTRKAFISKENNIRITLDYNIIGTEVNMNIFDENMVQNSLLSQDVAVLEVKYNGFLLSYIKDAIDRCNEIQSSISKYSLSRSISKNYRF